MRTIKKSHKCNLPISILDLTLSTDTRHISYTYEVSSLVRGWIPCHILRSSAAFFSW